MYIYIYNYRYSMSSSYRSVFQVSLPTHTAHVPISRRRADSGSFSRRPIDLTPCTDKIGKAIINHQVLVLHGSSQDLLNQSVFIQLFRWDTDHIPPLMARNTPSMKNPSETRLGHWKGDPESQWIRFSTELLYTFLTGSESVWKSLGVGFQSLGCLSYFSCLNHVW